MLCTLKHLCEFTVQEVSEEATATPGLIVAMVISVVLNKFLKKLGDEEGTEREDIVLEIELVDHTAPCEWFFGDKLLEPSDRQVATATVERSRTAVCRGGIHY